MTPAKYCLSECMGPCRNLYRLPSGEADLCGAVGGDRYGIPDAFPCLFPAAFDPAVKARKARPCMGQFFSRDRFYNEVILTFYADSGAAVKEPFTDRTGRIMVQASAVALSCISLPGLPYGGRALKDLIKPARLFCIQQDPVRRIRCSRFCEFAQKEGR